MLRDVRGKTKDIVTEDLSMIFLFDEKGKLVRKDVRRVFTGP